MLGNLFRYEGDMLYKKRKNNSPWTRCNDLKPNNGYINIRVNGKMMKLHRLVYLFHHPEWDISDSRRDNSIDHINGNTLDNRIENLRVVNCSQNKQNATLYGGNPIRGICFHRGCSKWGAYWQVDGKRKNKYFKTEAEALEYRAEMVALHYTHDPLKRC